MEFDFSLSLLVGLSLVILMYHVLVKSIHVTFMYSDLYTGNFYASCLHYLYKDNGKWRALLDFFFS